MSKEFIKIVKKYNNIIITRHSNPDMDAIGSQVGLAKILKDNFPTKNIYLTGDSNRMDYENLMQNVHIDIYKDALLIITDVAVSHMVADKNYLDAKEIIVIDHHKNECDIPNVSLKIIDTEAEAAALIVAELALSLKLKISPNAANYLLYGIITDSGRFQYIKNAKRLFGVAKELSHLGADPTKLYSWLYVQSKKDKQLEILYDSKIVFDEPIAYIMTTKEDWDILGEQDFFRISRGMVGRMAGIDEVKIWANFTYNKDLGKVICEFRSRTIPIVDIAKKYGGGGHDFACGATIDDFNVAKLVIDDFKELLKEKEN